MEKQEFPFISALLVTRNEVNYIENSLLSLVNQTYPKERYEIIVVDGGSTDGTLDVIQRLTKENARDGLKIRLIDNPKKILASGWNLGIQNAVGEYVIRIDAHAEAASNFIEQSVKTMLQMNVACVGGKLVTKPLENDNPIVSKVLSSPFGVGNSSFRVSNTAGYADTAVYGLYKKSIFDKVGYFNEKYVRNQDIELHSRIRKAGEKFYFDPNITCTYYSRNSVKKMIKQAYGNGKWNMVLLKNKTGALSIRHLVPFAFVLYLLASILGGIVWKPIWWLAIAVLALYFTFGVFAAVHSSNKMSEILKMPFLFLSLHCAYGYGYITGIFTNV